MKRAFHQVEHLRLHCLQQMGISSYYPRFLLPGALPSVALPQDDAVALPAEATAQAAADSRVSEHDARRPAGNTRQGGGIERAQDLPPAAARAGAQAEARAMEGLPAAAARRPRAVPAGDADAGTSQPLQFQLLLFSVNAELAVLLQLPALARPALQPRQALLLQNMLRWLGLPVELSPQPRRFQWPLPGMKPGADAAGAALGLRHFIEQAVLEQPFTRLLLLGQQLTEQLAGASPVPATLPLVCTHSLDAMLAVPALKREAWQALLPLQAALQPV